MIHHGIGIPHEYFNVVNAAIIGARYGLGTITSRGVLISPRFSSGEQKTEYSPPKYTGDNSDSTSKTRNIPNCSKVPISFTIIAKT
jgi:hypothetical protein